jgi:hypothetical protein
VHAFSAATREGLDDLLLAIERLILANPERPAPRAVPLGRTGPETDDQLDDAEEGSLSLEYVE